MKPGKLIRLLRVAEGLKQKELADELAGSISYLSQVESGKKEPSLNFLIRIAEYFKIPLSLLVPDEAKGNYKVMEKLSELFGDVLATKYRKELENE